jgi:hypothetical protein
MDMEFEWDPAKAAANLRKHGIPFRMACEVFKDIDHLESLEDSCDYGEERWIVLGCVKEKVLAVVYAIRGNRTRLISARKATQNEEREYRSGGLSTRP